MSNQRKSSPNLKHFCRTKRPSLIENKHENLKKMMNSTQSEAIIKPLAYKTIPYAPESISNIKKICKFHPSTNELHSIKRRSRVGDYIRPKCINTSSNSIKDEQEQMRNLKAGKTYRVWAAEQLESKPFHEAKKNTSLKLKHKDIEKSNQERIEKSESTYKEKFTGLVSTYNKLIQKEERTAQQSQDKDGKIETLQTKIAALERNLTQAQKELTVKELE